MIKKNALKQLIILIAITLFFALNNGMAQVDSEKIRQIYIDNIVRLTVEALNDSSINIAYCEVPDISRLYGAREILYKSGDSTRFSEPVIWGLRRIAIRELLRGGVNIDSILILIDPAKVHTGPMETQYPVVSFRARSKWIVFFDSPYLRIRRDHDYAMGNLKEYEEKLRGQVNLNANNYFTVYEDACAFCTYFPEDTKYPPMFIFSEDLVDDFRTIIELQENPSVLLESADSYDRYYSLIKDDFGKRIFTKLFDSKKDVVEMVANALNDSSISIALGKKQSHTWFTVSDSGDVTNDPGGNFKRLSLIEIRCMEILRGNTTPGSIIYLGWFTPGNEDRNTIYLSLIIHNSKPECIFLLESPYCKRNSYQVSLLKLYEKYDKHPPLNSNNFFSLYEMGTGALPVHIPENYNWPSEFIYSKELVDDLKTIIKLQKNPLLLSESSDSYEIYYNSMNDDLGKRVFSRLFENPGQE